MTNKGDGVEPESWQTIESEEYDRKVGEECVCEEHCGFVSPIEVGPGKGFVYEIGAYGGEGDQSVICVRGDTQFFLSEAEREPGIGDVCWREHIRV